LPGHHQGIAHRSPSSSGRMYWYRSVILGHCGARCAPVCSCPRKFKYSFTPTLPPPGWQMDICTYVYACVVRHIMVRTAPFSLAREVIDALEDQCLLLCHRRRPADRSANHTLHARLRADNGHVVSLSGGFLGWSTAFSENGCFNFESHR